MSEFSSPNERDNDVTRSAEAGVKAMISALHEEKLPSAVVVDAALHILAAWDASRQMRFTVAERETCIQELVGMLPSYVDQSRAASWLPDAQGDDQAPP
jgi:hypothetical protein